MSSTRLPGKMLKTLQGLPVIDHVLDAAASAIGRTGTILLTSSESSDDPLVRHVKKKGFAVYRGELDNVFGRFRACLEKHPCDWFFRICGDSPFLDPNLLKTAWKRTNAAGQTDIITNVFPKTFPPGQSVELINAKTFLGVDTEKLDDEQREHVTTLFYRHPEIYRIRSLRAEHAYPIEPGFTIDTPEDLARLERHQGRPRFAIAQ